MPKFDAELRDARFIPVEKSDLHEVGEYIIGHIYNDSKGRFYDGQYIHTNLVVSKRRLKSHPPSWSVKTLNTSYQVFEA